MSKRENDDELEDDVTKIKFMMTTGRVKMSQRWHDLGIVMATVLPEPINI